LFSWRVSRLWPLGYIASFRPARPRLNRISVSFVPVADESFTIARIKRASVESVQGASSSATTPRFLTINSEPGAARRGLAGPLGMDGVEEHESQWAKGQNRKPGSQGRGKGLAVAQMLARETSAEEDGTHEQA